MAGVTPDDCETGGGRWRDEGRVVFPVADAVSRRRRGSGLRVLSLLLSEYLT